MQGDSIACKPCALSSQVSKDGSTEITKLRTICKAKADLAAYCSPSPAPQLHELAIDLA